MSWQLSVRSAETILQSSRIPPSEEIISLIKQVNPTRLYLSQTEREHGYQIKNRLQNLLLENYGEAFHLAPDPCCPGLLLIKHNALPSIDACHADQKSLSPMALDTVGNLAVRPTKFSAKSEANTRSRKPVDDSSPKAALANAELLLERYEYPQAEEILAALQVSDAGDLLVLVKAARLLGEEMGAYQRAIELLLVHGQFHKDKAVREILAQSYYGNGMISEARDLFAATHPADLGKSALLAYAELCFKEANLQKAFHLVKLSEEKEGFVTAHADLRKEIEAAMLEEARPFQQQAEDAFAHGDLVRAESLLQQALSHYPNFPQARRLAGEIEALETKAESARLWARFDSSKTAADRLELLAQLFEQDKPNADKIRTLAAGEKSRQKQETVKERLQTLQALAARESWDPCCDILLWLSHQGDEESYRRACALSPLFSLLYHNKKLQRLSDQEAKELWLKFVRLKLLEELDSAQSRWKTLQELKRYFHCYPVFKGEYEWVLAEEQENARQEVEQLLERLEKLVEQEVEQKEEQGEERTSESTLSEARRLVAQLRKRAELLPADDASWYKEEARRELNRLEPEGEYQEGILDYRDYLLLGNSAKAAKFRESHNLPLMQDLIKMIDSEIAEKFAISAEPIALTVTPDLAVDLACGLAPSGLEHLHSSQRHLVFRESAESIVVVNVVNMSATRYRSPRFEQLCVIDVLPDRDVFLFIDDEANSTLWRATLSETESRFTATFELGEHFLAWPGASVNGFFMSSTKDNVYYAFMEDGDKVQAVKQNIDQISIVERTFEVKGRHRAAYRLSCRPDRFVLLTEDSTTVLESNLTPPTNCSKVGSGQQLKCLAINALRSQIYALGDGIVNVLNPTLRAVKQYLKAESTAHMDSTSKCYFCVEKSTVLFNNNGTGVFYNIETNKFSQKFCLRPLFCTETPSRWYYLESDLTKPGIRIKDLTDEMESLLEWQVFLPVGADEEAAQRFVERFADPEYFSIVQPVSRPEDTATLS